MIELLARMLRLWRNTFVDDIQFHLPASLKRDQDV